MDSWPFHHLQRGHADYENARRSACWNGRVPNQYPEIITYPESGEHVQTVVGYAKQHSLSIGTKSGGHSWTCSFLRDEGILVDLGKMNHFSFDVDAQTAEVQPAAYGSDLNRALKDHNLMFPAGHCPTVGLGGFLLQGGFGWNSRKWGVACESVLAIDVVTADGALIHATANENSDFYWAARGAGCGYFGLVTRFYLQLYQLPSNIMTSRYVFQVSDLDEVVKIVDDASEQFPPELEMSCFVMNGPDGRPTVAVVADELGESQEEAKRALDIIHDLLPLEKALDVAPHIACTMTEMLARFDFLLDNRGLHYEVDNMWTDESAQKLLPSFHKVSEHLGPPPTHLYLYWWLPVGERQQMAFSMEARLYVAMYAISNDASKDSQHSKLVVDSIKSMEEHTKGIQLADENLPASPGKFMETQSYLRLESLRKKHDPDNRFYGYIRIPKEFEEARASL